ncbi:hypothetical protein [Pseudoblastomonas halimionae]|uniref:Uncharacterized protein n=1 Tax=Alteriqipengyuania halimionae TaxID=1926630 RepID=A0A6I4U2I7_9SPHN|nr:hypothetical protein [Alteriqipengyuania halimionae]MXP09153.1 hypothetical protein [Alteriqipengyuania halimionae]
MAVRIVLSLLFAWLCIAPANAEETSTAPFVVSLYGAEARVCVDSAASEPDFASHECRTQSLGRVDPQGRQLWIALPFHVPGAMLSRSEPLGLFVRAKASSAIWLNGEPLGTNGLPAATKVDEIPGLMDVVFFVPPDMLRPGANRLVVRMSALHGGMKLS